MLSRRADAKLALIAGTYVNVFALILPSFYVRPSWHVYLVSFSGWNEALGILLIASPELLRYGDAARRFFSARFRERSRRAQRWVQRLLKLPISPTRDTGTVRSTTTLHTDTTKGVVGPGSGMSDAEKIDWLVKRMLVHEQRLDGLLSSVERLPNAWREDDDRLRAEVERRLSALKGEISEARIGLRLCGLAYVILGVVLGAAANLV
jgi:hypothetical protein